ncbi:MAG: hypothetical protein ACP5RN_15355, partial [Armatimonadota bacterium]
MKPGGEVTLIAIQMRTTLEDYQSEKHLEHRLDALLASAMRRVRSGVPTLVVFPEDIGLGMLFLDDFETVNGCRSIYE